MNLSRTNGTFSPALNFFRSLPGSPYCTLYGARLVCGQVLWVPGRRLPSGAHLISVSDAPCDHVLDEYKKRWEIDVLFEALKSRGFNFEETHLKDEKRLQTLFAVLAIAFCWAYHVGAWRHAVQPIRIKKHQRPAKSILRYGFDWIRQALFHPQDKPELLTHVRDLLWQALTGPKALVYQLYPM